MSRPFAQLRFEDVPEAPRLPHRYFDARVETVSFDSAPFGKVDVHVRVLGSGPPLLLVHGFMTSSYSWRYALGPLSERFTCYAPDLVGSGRSSKPDAFYGPDALATSIGETMRALGVYGARVIGNSLGGYLAMRLALDDRRAMKRLVNVHSPGIPTGRMVALEWATSALPFLLRLVASRVEKDPERWVHQNVHYFDETLKSREEHREYAAPLRTPEGRRAFARMLRETLTASQMRAFVTRLVGLSGTFPVPLLLLYAAEDPMVPPVVGERLHALLPSARYVRVAKGSHFMHVDAVGAFAEASIPFLLEEGDEALVQVRTSAQSL